MLNIVLRLQTSTLLIIFLMLVYSKQIQFPSEQANPFLNSQKLQNMMQIFEKEQIDETFQQKGNQRQIIMIDSQYKFIVINSSTILTTMGTTDRFMNLILININQKTKMSKVYPNMRVINQNFCLKLFDENTILLYLQNKLYFININNLNIREEVSIQNKRGPCFIQRYLGYRNGSKQNTIVVGNQSPSRFAHVLELNNELNKYQKINEIQNIVKYFFLNSSNQGLFINQNMVRLDNLRQNYKIYQGDFKSGYFSSPVNVVSNSQQLIICPDTWSFKTIIGLHKLNKTNFTLNLQYQRTIYLQIDPNKIKFTKDDKHVFMKFKQQYGKYYHSIAVLNTQKFNITYFDSDDKIKAETQCHDYGILDDDKFVLLCSYVENSNDGEKYYQLRLYNLSNFKITDTYSLVSGTNTLQIVTNPSFNLTFILKTLVTEKNPEIKVFKVINNKIVLMSTPANLNNFKIFTYCLNYLIGKYKNENYHSFIDIKDFEVVKKITLSRSNKYAYIVQNNILVITTYKLYEVYDLSRLNNLTEDWKLCNFYIQQQFVFWLILPKERYIFERYDGLYSNYTIKGFDLQKCPTKTRIPILNDSQMYTQKVLYKIMVKNSGSEIEQSKINQRRCNLVFTLIPLTLNIIYTFEDCQPYKTPSKAVIQREDTSGLLSIRLTSNFKYIILIFIRIYTDQ